MRKVAFGMAALILIGGNLFAQLNMIPMMRKSPFHETFLERPSEQMASTQQDSNVTLIGRWPNGPCYATFVVGDYAYIGNGGALDILDISDQYAYVADGDAGLRMIEVSRSSSPTEVGFYDTGGFASGVYVLENVAYVADGNDELYILQNNLVTEVVDHDETVVPDNFSLGQNYPNPFNTTTSIQYTLPGAERRTDHTTPRFFKNIQHSWAGGEGVGG